MKKHRTAWLGIIVACMMLFSVAVSTLAGSLEPTAEPGPTMVSLGVLDMKLMELRTRIDYVAAGKGVLCYYDADMDGFGSDQWQYIYDDACPDAYYATNNSDCDDTDPAISRSVCILGDEDNAPPYGASAVYMQLCVGEGCDPATEDVGDGAIDVALGETINYRFGLNWLDLEWTEVSTALVNEQWCSGSLSYDWESPMGDGFSRRDLSVSCVAPE